MYIQQLLIKSEQLTSVLTGSERTDTTPSTHSREHQQQQQQQLTSLNFSQSNSVAGQSSATMFPRASLFTRQLSPADDTHNVEKILTLPTHKTLPFFHLFTVQTLSKLLNVYLGKTFRGVMDLQPF